MTELPQRHEGVEATQRGLIVQRQVLGVHHDDPLWAVWRRFNGSRQRPGLDVPVDDDPRNDPRA